eukprot:13040361-Alexandrium_andersonii.AAC.1
MGRQDWLTEKVVDHLFPKPSEVTRGRGALARVDEPASDSGNRAKDYRTITGFQDSRFGKDPVNSSTTIKRG